MTGTNFTIRQNGLGSFHAFHAAVVLAIGLLSPDSATEFVETKGILSKSLQQFASLSVRSIFCNKAVPLVRQIMFVSSSFYMRL